MKVIQINTFPYKATGTIMMNNHNHLLKNNVESYVVWGRGRSPENPHEFLMNNSLDVKIHGVYTRITDKTGFGSVSATKKLLRKIDEIKPDIIHLHNIHGYYINIKLLFEYIAKNNIKTVWTLHDCWPFTGHCAYFDAVGCDKWKTGCSDCPQKKTYPSSMLMDGSKWNYDTKKKLFTSVGSITFVTPSMWLAGLTKQSFLGKYPVMTINNGINTEIFKPSDSDIRKKYSIENKKILLGVASEWTPRKGLDDFIRLSSIIDNNKYKIILIGLDKKQLENIPKDILAFERTGSATELAEFYSTADVFLNLTYEDNYPTTNLEALACGTPVITYKTGGSVEPINKSNGMIVPQGDLNALRTAIDTVCEYKNSMSAENANVGFDKMNNSYLMLYRKLMRD